MMSWRLHYFGLENRQKEHHPKWESCSKAASMKSVPKCRKWSHLCRHPRKKQKCHSQSRYLLVSPSELLYWQSLEVFLFIFVSVFASKVRACSCFLDFICTTLLVTFKRLKIFEEDFTKVQQTASITKNISELRHSHNKSSSALVDWSVELSF